MQILPRQSLELTTQPGVSAPRSLHPRRWSSRAITIALVTTLFLGQAIPAGRLVVDGRDVPLPLAVGTINFLLIPILLTLVDWLLARRARSVLSRAMLGALLAAFVGGAMAALLWSGVVPGVARDFNVVAPTETVFTSFFLGAVLSVLVVGAWSLGAVFPRVLEQEQVRALQVANLELEAAQLRAQGELARLRGQLEPHFLLNTLHLISGLVGMDAEKARRTIVNLGDLLRDALEPHDEEQTIEDEIQWLERYSEILVARHGPILSFEWDVDPRARAARLPRLLLQPLVENAIVHGALRAARQGRVVVRVRIATEQRIEICVEDNGPGVTGNVRAGAVGIANVRRRLELTRPGATFEMETGSSGTRALLRLPHEPHLSGARG